MAGKEIRKEREWKAVCVDLPRSMVTVPAAVGGFWKRGVMHA